MSMCYLCGKPVDGDELIIEIYDEGVFSTVVSVVDGYNVLQQMDGVIDES